LLQGVKKVKKNRAARIGASNEGVHA